MFIGEILSEMWEVECYDSNFKPRHSNMLLLYSVLDKVSGLSCSVLNFLCVDFVLQGSVKIWISIRNYSKVNNEETQLKCWSPAPAGFKVKILNFLSHAHCAES